MTEPLSIAVVVVSFNAKEVLEPCLRSVVAVRPAQTVVVDNGSTDGSIELVRTEFPQMELLVNRVNRGYGSAANQGIRACRTPVSLLLNSDTIVAPAALTALGTYLAEHSEVGCVGPRLMNRDGTLQRSTQPFPSVADTLVAETGAHLVLRRLPGLRNLSLRTWPHNAARRVPWVLGAAMAIRRTAFDTVGGFDEGLFMYGEDVDFSRRLAQAGFETHFSPVTTVVHVGGASTQKVAGAMRQEYLTGLRAYLERHESARSRARIMRVMRAIVRARVIRDALLVRVVSDEDVRRRLLEARDAGRALLAESAIWSP